jgi:hypothetical protein
MNRTIKEFQTAPRYQCKFKLHRVVNVKVHGGQSFGTARKKATCG